MEILDITLIRWLTIFLIMGAIVYIGIIAKKANSIYLAIPLLVWLFQALIFYSVFFLYFYGVFYIPITTAERLFPYWASISRFMELLMLWLYLYYMQHSYRRGNGKL